MPDFSAFAVVEGLEKRFSCVPSCHREKERMRGSENQSVSFSNPLTPTRSRRERGSVGQQWLEFELKTAGKLVFYATG
jgi:hypothetical protein